jgi:hypothetical protein
MPQEPVFKHFTDCKQLIIIFFSKEFLKRKQLIETIKVEQQKQRM